MSLFAPATVEEAVAHVRSGDTIVAPLFPGLGKRLLRAVCARLHELRDITLLCGDLEGRHDYLDAIPEGAAADRLRMVVLAGASPRRRDIPVEWAAMPLFQIARCFTTRRWPVDVCILPLTPPGPDGLCRISPTLAWLADAAAAARTLIAEVSDSLPHVEGDNAIDPKRVASWIASSEAPVPYVERNPPNEAQRAIARHTAACVPDGACLQIGIGSIVEALLAELRGHRDLGLHSGSLPDGAMALIEAGVMTNGRNPAAPGLATTTSIRGSARLYAFANRNAGIRLRAFSYVHDPRTIARIPDFTTINSALAVDVYGQVTAESVHGRFRQSGGGQMDFTHAAQLSPGGRTIVTLPAVDAKTGQSRLVKRLAAGELVTGHRAYVDFVVTEFGAADLRGATLQERRRRIAAVAHPEHRESLLRDDL